MEGAVPAGFKQVREGQAAILFPQSGEVFYNPVQEFNRDLRFKLLWLGIHIQAFWSLIRF